MAKTRAPLLSLEAMGSLSGVLTMSRGKRQSYTKYSRKPKDPQTIPQLGRRAWFQGLANAWPLLPAASQDTWSNMPRDNHLSNYNAYLRYNLERVDRGEMPSSLYPYGGIMLVGFISTPLLQPGPRHIEGTWQYSDVRNNWLCVLYSHTGIGFTPARATTFRVLTKQDLNPFKVMHAPLPAGTHYYRYRSVATDGATFLWSGEYNATVPPS